MLTKYNAANGKNTGLGVRRLDSGPGVFICKLLWVTGGGDGTYGF